jgi:hypothetical protein
VEETRPKGRILYGVGFVARPFLERLVVIGRGWIGAERLGKDINSGGLSSRTEPLVSKGNSIADRRAETLNGLCTPQTPCMDPEPESLLEKEKTVSVNQTA